MQRASNHPRNFSRVLVAAALLTLGPSTGALAQDSGQEARPASSAPDQPKRRERRRAAEAAAASTDAQARAADAAPAVAAAETVESELVCKSIEVAGSKIARRVCGTPEQWASQGRRASRAAQDAIQEIRDRSSFPAPPEVPTEASVGIPVSR
jgi:hypothetical protein